MAIFAFSLGGIFIKGKVDMKIFDTYKSRFVKPRTMGGCQVLWTRYQDENDDAGNLDDLMEFIALDVTCT